MAHQEGVGGIVKTPPEAGLVQVEENHSMVLRSAWGSTPYSAGMSDGERRAALAHVRPGQPVDSRLFEGYLVKREGWRLFIPGLVHDFVATVPLAPRQEDVGPIDVNVADGLRVAFNIRFATVVGELNWRHYQVPLNQALAVTQWSELCREAQRNGETFILVRDPDEPFDKARPFVTNDSAIIRAALRPENIWYEAKTAIASALNEAAQSLGAGVVEPLGVASWLNQPVARTPGHRLPIRRQQETNRTELMEQVTVMANESLHRFGIVIFDVRLEGIALPEALRLAKEQEQSAAVAGKAAVHRKRAVQLILDAGGLGKLPKDAGPLDRAAQAYAFGRAIESLDAQSGVPSNKAPIISVTGDIASGNSLMGPAAGGSKGAPGGKKPGGAGRTK